MVTSQQPPPLRTAMILAAGYGTRMAELTRDLPKPLLPLNGMPIIEVVIRKLARQGIERAVVNLHYLPEKMREFLGDGSRFGLEILFSEEPQLLGSGGGIANAEKFFQGETILAANADVLCDLDIGEFYDFHCRAGVLATLAVQPSSNHRDYSLALFDAANSLKGFLGKNEEIPGEVHAGIFTGYQILTPGARAYLKPENQSIISELYRKALGRGERIAVFPFSGRWIDLGEREFYLSLLQKIRSGEVEVTDFIK